MKNTNFSIEDIIVLETEDVMEQDALLKIKGGTACSPSCSCGSGNSNSGGGTCTCGSANNNFKNCLGFA
ncbi:MAG: hypothetical protein CSB01_00530 [Bacteroidia bacterium]|nr:MAG: hypothetical protein CSB01_00530 [Bacteroidia bacterium]